MERGPASIDAVDEEVTAGAVALTLSRPRKPDDLISREDYERDERLPYWADLWPSARVLAAALAADDLAGRTVLELGAGLGLPSLVAAAGGARVLATDWYEDALAFTARNAERAGLAVETMSVDWRDPPPALLARAPFDRVVAADVLYEARNGVALATLLPRLVGPGSRVWIADPRRPEARGLLDALAAAGWRRDSEEVGAPTPPDESGAIVRLHRLRPPPEPTKST